MGICGVCCVGTAFAPHSIPAIPIVLFLIGKFASAGAFAVIFNYTFATQPAPCPGLTLT